MNIQKTSILLITLILSFPILAKSGKVKISGHVKNQTVSLIKITDFSRNEVASSQLDTNGNFKMNAKIEQGYYVLNYGRSTAYVYLYPKDDLEIEFDAKHFIKTLAFYGEGSERNNYLAHKSILESDITEDLQAFYNVNESTYLENIENLKKKKLELIDEYDLSDFFIEEETKSIEYGRLLKIQNFKNSHKFYIGEDIEPSADFYYPLNGIDLNNLKEYKSQIYYHYLVNSIWNKRIEEASDVESMLEILRRVKHKEIGIVLLNGFYSKISTKNERSKDYLDLIKTLTTYKPFIEAAEKRYQDVVNSNALKEGDEAPSFKYESITGETISLSDLKGKYVYIDVWATWCSPCLKQVPYLKELEKQYHDKNIVFVSISVDKEREKSTWKQMIRDKALGGLQLFADKSFDSDFLKAFAVNSIPRFILIDTEGKIIDTEAPRPSFDKTKIMLDDLLK